MKPEQEFLWNLGIVAGQLEKPELRDYLTNAVRNDPELCAHVTRFAFRLRATLPEQPSDTTPQFRKKMRG